MRQCELHMCDLTANGNAQYSAICYLRFVIGMDEVKSGSGALGRALQAEGVDRGVD